ncbi:WD40-repeat-containing domain protein [Lanmaoa asiatica]|nr:WD40-repeat-containing domain protein [Lanmaoa asiatica]
MAEPKTTRKAERNLKKARIERSVVTRKGFPSDQQQLAKSAPSVSFSPKDKRKRKETHENTVNTPKPSSKSELPASFVVVAGSYEKLLYGLDGTVTPSESGYEFHLKPIFIFPAHVSSIKAVAASPNGGKWLATGSSDEIVKVWDLARRKEIGGLMHHQGSITYLQFPSRSHLLSASEDGTLCLFHARDWTVLRSLKGHKGRVNSVAVHPSGKVALSVGHDKTLRMWDLMRGKGSASTKLGKEGEVVRWSSSGSMFIVQSLSSLDVFSTDMALRHTITHPSRIHSLRFCKRVYGDGELLLVAAEDKKVSIYQVSEDPQSPPTIIAEMIGHLNRVKAVETLHIVLPKSTSKSGGARETTIVVCTISSDGKIFVYDLAALPAETKEKLQLHPVAEYDTKGTRLTCLAVAEGRSAGGSTVMNGKRKNREKDASSEEEAELKPQFEADASVEAEESGDEEL